MSVVVRFSKGKEESKEERERERERERTQKIQKTRKLYLQRARKLYSRLQKTSMEWQRIYLCNSNYEHMPRICSENYLNV